MDEKVIAAEVIGYKTTLVHLGFALVSRIYDRGAPCTRRMQLLGANINGENKLFARRTKGRNRAAGD